MLTSLHFLQLLLNSVVQSQGQCQRKAQGAERGQNLPTGKEGVSEQMCGAQTVAGLNRKTKTSYLKQQLI